MTNRIFKPDGSLKHRPRPTEDKSPAKPTHLKSAREFWASPSGQPYPTWRELRAMFAELRENGDI